jgi:hypothetical protein
MMSLFARRAALLGLASLLGAASAFSAELELKLQIPSMEVAEYHRPYVAVWIERPDQTLAAHLAVWYQVERKSEDGAQWLKDLRQWWRRGGREQAMPLDGVTGATRPVGEHQVRISGTDKRLASLPAGNYSLVVEAAREAGGREVLRIPFDWPAKQKQQLSAQGKNELGTLWLNITP